MTTETSTWEAIYDPLGRRIQTAFSPQDTSPTITTAFYDPEEEFREIGLFHSGHTFWKLGRDNTCDAIIDDQGQTAYLIHNSLDHLNAVIYPDGTIITTPSVDIYGSKQPSLPAHEITSYAQTLAWHSKQTDPTGLIWLGKRYYNPQTGRFLSPDPVGGFACIDMYGYVMGDPINFYDLDGRWASFLYKKKIMPGAFGVADALIDHYSDVAGFIPDLLIAAQKADVMMDDIAEGRPINKYIANTRTDLFSYTLKNIGHFAFDKTCDLCGVNLNQYRTNKTYTSTFERSDLALTFVNTKRLLLAIKNPSKLVKKTKHALSSIKKVKTKPRFSGKTLGNNPAVSPGKNFEWKGSGRPGSGKGNWYNQKTGESLHPDFNHPGGMKPHWDYRIRGEKERYRLFLDGTWETK